MTVTGAFEVIAREKEMVRLGSSSGDMKRLAPDAIERTRVALLDYAEVITRTTASRHLPAYAAVVALRNARHIVRSEPEARVLVVTVELSTLHLQPANDIEPLLAMLQFGDGAAAALGGLAPRLHGGP